MSLANALPGIHCTDKHLHPLSANDLYFGAGPNHLVGGPDYRAPEFAADSYVTSRSQIALRCSSRPDQPCQSGHARFVRATQKWIQEKVF
jgi:hypothetical protein